MPKFTPNRGWKIFVFFLVFTLLLALISASPPKFGYEHSTLGRLGLDSEKSPELRSSGPRQEIDRPHSTKPKDSTDVRIAMTENDGIDLTAYEKTGLSAPGVASSKALRFHQTGGKWEVETGTSCTGPWKKAKSGVVDPVSTPLKKGGEQELCSSSGGIYVYGTLEALYNSTNSARSVNTLPLEQYVADTVPGESPSYWATLGGAGPQGRDWGFQELEAQAVAVRSYALAYPNGYGGYADTCDLSCQYYRGTTYQTSASIAAAQDTAGQVLEMPSGTIADTEYSASSGGYSTGGAFTIVSDTGDQIKTNPNHDWTASLPISTIDSVWPSIGTFTGFSTVVGNGHKDKGDSYSRAVTLKIVGTKGSVSTTGPGFSDTLGLKSDWFELTGIKSGNASFAGHGWGHGIGMGQWGALGYAIDTDNSAGHFSYTQILAHYYKPATLATLAASHETGGGSGDLGYWLANTKGGVFTFGNAKNYGSLTGIHLVRPIVGMAATKTGKGYWMVATDGGIFAFGNAKFLGSMGGKHLNKPVIGMTPTPTDGGYWMVATDGGIFAFGNAKFYGSMGGQHLNKPIVAIDAIPTGRGYWMVATDGGIFAFRRAKFYGSTGAHPPLYPIFSMASAKNGGYWLLDICGGIHAFGSALSYGNGADTAINNPSIDVMASSTTKGYLIVTSEGTVTAFGSAAGFGGVDTSIPSNASTIVASALT